MNMSMAPSSWIVTHLCRRRLPAHALRWLLPLLLLAPAAFAQYATFSPQDEQEIVRLVNRERRSLGLATLVIDERLQEAARKHSVRMAAAGEIEHQFRGESKLSVRLNALRFDVCGENVAMASDAAHAHDALMHSPGHRANILDAQYNAIGVGVVRTSNQIFVTQDFARRLPEASVEEAEAQVAANLNRLRRMARAPVLNRVSEPELRQLACEMANKNKLNPSAGLSLSPKVSNSITFTASDLDEIPESLERLKTSAASGFAVGACYQTSKSYETPVFWIIVVTYQ